MSPIALLAFVAAAGAAVWAVSTRSTPSFAAYDSLPAAIAPAPRLVSDSARADPARRDSLARDSITRHRVRAAAPAAPPASDTVARPHRSDNYGGYGGYGARERRGSPNGK